MKINIGFSSEIYHIHIDDLLRLPFKNDVQFPDVKDDILLMIGNRDPAHFKTDIIIKGQDALQRAKAQGQEFVAVRVVLHNNASALFNFLGAFNKPTRTKIEKYSQLHYRILISDITENSLERNIKTEDTAYNFTKKKWRLGEDERQDRLTQLKDSFSQNGYDYNHPMQIMLCRSFGVKDQLQQGHHRMMLCKIHHVHVVSVIFMHSTFLPLQMHGFLLNLMKMLKYKQIK